MNDSLTHNTSAPSSSSSQQEQRHYRIACQACRSLHRKCDKILPSCSQCIANQRSCEYTPPKKRIRSKRKRPQNEPSQTTQTNEKRMREDSLGPISTIDNPMMITLGSNNNNNPISIVPNQCTSQNRCEMNLNNHNVEMNRVPANPEVPFKTSDLVNFYYKECSAEWNLVPKHLVCEAVAAAENKKLNHQESNNTATIASVNQFDLHVNEAVWCSVQMMSLGRIVSMERHEEEMERRVINIVQQLRRICKMLLLRADIFDAIPNNEKLAWAAMNMSIFERVHENRGAYAQWMGLVKSYLKSAQVPTVQLKACYETFKWRTDCARADAHGLRGYDLILKSLRKRLRLNEKLVKLGLWNANSTGNHLLEELISVLVERISKKDQSTDLVATSRTLDLLQQLVDAIPSVAVKLDAISGKMDCLLNEESRLSPETSNEDLNQLYKLKRQVSDQISLFLASFPSLPLDTLWMIRQVCVAITVHYQAALRGEPVLDILSVDVRILELLEISRKLPEKGVSLLRDVKQWIADQSRQTIVRPNTQPHDQHQYLNLNTNVSSFVDSDLPMDALLLDDATVLQILADLAPANSILDANFMNLF